MTDRDNLWQNLTRDEITEARDAGAVVAIPIGAIEQHGSHLPADTDPPRPTAITGLAASRGKTATVLVAPSLPYGFSPHHLSHAGTISLRLSTYLAVLGDIASCLAQQGFRGIDLATDMAEILRRSVRKSRSWSPTGFRQPGSIIGPSQNPNG